MFKVNDIVFPVDGGQNMIVSKVEKCLDCKAVLVTCIWYEGDVLRSNTFRTKELTLVAAAPLPPPRPRNIMGMPAPLTDWRAVPEDWRYVTTAGPNTDMLRWTLANNETIDAGTVTGLLEDTLTTQLDPATATGERLQELMTLTGFDDPNTDPY